MGTLKNRIRRRRLERAGVRPEIDPGFAVIHDYAVHADELGPSSVVYSFGIGRHIGFDLQLIERWGVTVHGFDPTPVSIDWVRSQDLPRKFVFHDCGIAAFDGRMTFHAPRRTGSAHFSPVRRYRLRDAGTAEGTVRRLRTIAGEFGHRAIDLLKMDIEGGEYEVIPDLLASGIPIRQFVIEFHHNYSSVPLRRTVDAVGTLRRAGFRLFYVGERSYEMSFLRLGP